MTRKHYREIARILHEQYRWTKDTHAEEVVRVTASELATLCKQDNPRFNRAQFMDAIFDD
jgi:hypothetical protein